MTVSYSASAYESSTCGNTARRTPIRGRAGGRAQSSRKLLGLGAGWGEAMAARSHAVGPVGGSYSGAPGGR
eukprot:3403136-Prymnesium_polylepis.1